MIWNEFYCPKNKLSDVNKTDKKNRQKFELLVCLIHCGIHLWISILFSVLMPPKILAAMVVWSTTRVRLPIWRPRWLWLAKVHVWYWPSNMTLKLESSFCTTTVTDPKKALSFFHGWMSRLDQLPAFLKTTERLKGSQSYSKLWFLKVWITVSI